MKTPKPLLTLRMVFPAAASLIVLLLGEWIARGSLTADTFASFIFPHIGAYLVDAAGLDLPLSTVVHAGHGGAGLCALRGELLHPAAAR